ncbi:M15 family metallopeptidase [Fundidesulfovibrio butyratiphilus]
MKDSPVFRSGAKAPANAWAWLRPRFPAALVATLCLAWCLALAVPALAVQPPGDLEILKACYPDVVRSVDQDRSGAWFVTLADGVRLPYDDGKAKSAEEALDTPDIEDMLAQVYPLGPVTAEPAPGFHPGRRRVASFFKAAYGHTPEEVKANLVTVDFLGKPVRFNGRNGAAKALEAVSAELSQLIARRPEVAGFLLPVSGTFAWRQIAGTERLSMHSFGAAIDVNAKRNTYWRWYKGHDPLGVRRAFPAEAAAIFERHGFVWGGKWAEFDIMHFEYRPELIAKARQTR